MGITKTKIKPITPEEAHRRLEWQREQQRWETAEQSWRITRDQVRRNVRDLRETLEDVAEQLEGVVFDVPCGDSPPSLGQYASTEIVEIVAQVNPVIHGYFTMLDQLMRSHGCADNLDANAKLFMLKGHAAETGFQIGVLAGVIFAGCAKEQVDRFERGLAFAMGSNPRLVKD